MDSQRGSTRRWPTHQRRALPEDPGSGTRQVGRLRLGPLPGIDRDPRSPCDQRLVRRIPHDSGLPASGMSSLPKAVLDQLAAAVGPRYCIADDSEIRTYESDGLTSFRAIAGAVVLPNSTEEVAAVVKIAKAAGIPIVPRGAGTGLSGGALPIPGSIVIPLTRMRRFLEVDPENGWIRVEPGVVNLDVSKRVGPSGYYYAPDPSSQSVCTIGGNVAENSGGAHCLKYGFTVHHVLGVEAVLPDGELVHLGGTLADTPGPDLLGLLVGSEGTLAVVTSITVRILRRPETVQTLLAAFDTIDAGGG